MKAIHFLCHQDGLRPRNSEELPPKGQGRYRLGWWALTSEETAGLKGGFAYLHEKSSAVSYSENRVEDHEVGEGEWSGLVGLILSRQPRLGHQKWRGNKAGQSPRDNFRIVPATLSHELEQV